MNEQSLAEAAVAYAKMGWYVFPLGARSKKPAVSGGRGCLDAKNDPEKIAQWWSKHPDHNIGLAVGMSDLYVIDVDGERGEESLQTLIAENEPFPESPVVKTGKGFHYYMKLPESRPGNTASKLGLGIDTRGEGGYVVLPPSIHPDGQQYEWLVEGIAPPPVPEWITDKFVKIAWIPPTYVPSAYSVNVHPYVRAVWENAQADLQSSLAGQRNVNLNNAAMTMGHWIASNSISRDRVEQELTEIAVGRLGLGLIETQKTLKSGIEAGMREPRYPPTPQPYVHENKHQQAARQSEGTISIQKGSAFGRKEVKYLWGKRVPLGKLTILAGPSSIGKSFVSLALAANVTAGVPMLDAGARVDGEVLFASYEDDIEDTIGPRADLLGVDMDRCHFIQGVDTTHGKRPFGPQDVPRIIDYLKAQPAIKLIIIDPLGSFLGSGSDGNSETEARAILSTLVDAAAETDTAVIIVAHFNKSSESPDPLHRVAGSQGITALPRSVLTVSWGEDKERIITHIKSSTSAEAETIGYSFEGGKFTWTGIKRDAGEVAKWLRTELEQAGGSMTANDVFKRAAMFGYEDSAIDAARDIVNPQIENRIWSLR